MVDIGSNNALWNDFVLFFVLFFTDREAEMNGWEELKRKKKWKRKMTATSKVFDGRFMNKTGVT